MKWFNEDVKYLYDNYKLKNVKELSIHLNRTIISLRRKLKRLNLDVLSEVIYWSKLDIQYLKCNISSKNNKELMLSLKRSESSINNMIMKLGISRNIRVINFDIAYNVARLYKTRNSLIKGDVGVYDWLLRNNSLDVACKHMISQKYSTPQLICKFIFDILIAEECVYNTRKIIKPYELDLYYTNYKLAIEYNGKYWHSKSDNTKLKIEMCKKLGIKLIVIEGNGINYEKDIKRDIIKFLPMLNSILDKNITVDYITDIVITDELYDSILDTNAINKIVNRYTIYSKFYKENKSLAAKLKRMKLDDKFTSHMYKRCCIKWNEELVRKELEKFDRIKSIRTESRTCYEYIKKNNLEYLFVEYKYINRTNKLYKL